MRCLVAAGSASYAAAVLAKSVSPSGAPSRVGTSSAYSSEQRGGASVNIMSVCHSRPASAMPTGLPFSITFETTKMSGNPGSWKSAIG